MFASAILVIPILACGSLGAIVGHIYRYRPMARRLVTLGVATLIFILAENISGTFSAKYSLKQNVITQLDLFGPFIILYLLPAFFTSFMVAKAWRRWWT